MRRLVIIVLALVLAASNMSFIPARAMEEDYDAPSTGLSVDQEIHDDDDQEPGQEPPASEPGPETPEPEPEPEPEPPSAPQEDYEEPEKKPGKEPGQDKDQDEDPIQDSGQVETKMIALDKDNISFGTVFEREDVRPQTFRVTNTGNAPVLINWTQADSARAFEITALSDVNQELQPGDEYEFQVSLNPLPYGDYTCNVTLEDFEDPSCQATISITVKVKEKKVEPPKEEPQEDPTEKGDQKKPDDDKNKKKPAEDKNKKKPAENSKSKRKTTTTYRIKAKCSPYEGGYVSGTGRFRKGEQAILTAYAESGFTFRGWAEKGKIVSESRGIAVRNISSDRMFTAKFERDTYRIKVKTDNEEAGKVSGGGRFKKNESTTIKAVPNKGYVLKGWYEGDELVSKNGTLGIRKISRDRTFKAVFKPSRVTLQAAVYPKGAGTVTGAGKYDYKSDVTLTAKPKEGYVFKSFVLNKQTLSIREKYKLKKLTKDLSITAYFEKKEEETCLMKSGVSNKGGFISPSGELSIVRSGDITYTIAPDNGYAIQEVSVDGKKVGPVKAYTFKNVQKGHTISVAFAPKKGNEKGVRKDKILSTKEAAKIAVARLNPADYNTKGRNSEIITPEIYEKMKEEGTLEEALKIPEQDIVGMDDAESLPENVEGYNYDEASGVLQRLDISPEKAKKLIEKGDDAEIIRAAYEEGYLNIVINNQYLIPGSEEKFDDDFEDDTTVKNMIEFVSGTLSSEEKMRLLGGKKFAVSLGITNGDVISDEEKAAMRKAGAEINEYFCVSVMKQEEGKEPETVKELTRPVEIVLNKPDTAKTDDCIVRLHEGRAEILNDIDDDDSTITIRTDKFSPYAFGKKTGLGSGNMLLYILGGGAVLIILAGIIAAGTLKKKRS